MMKTRTKIIMGIVAGMVVIAALAIPLGLFVARAEKSEKEKGAIYEKSYYEIMDSIDNAQTKLAKVNVVSGATVKRELLADVWKECGVAVTDMSALGMASEETETVTKFLNQVGDYAYYLMGKVSAGEELTKGEKDNVKRFYELLTKLKTDLTAIGEGMVDGNKISATTLSDLSAVQDAIKSYSSIDYPELIYDGPFSDGLSDREAKFLKGKNEISLDQAEEKLKEYFEGAKEITCEGEGKSSIESYLFTFKWGERECTAFITKKGGFLAAMNTFCEVNDPQKTEAECAETAEAFLKKAGYNDMEKVWVYNNNSVVYINFAYKQGETVFYPDLIKVKVSAQTGEVVGMEGSNYIYNHGDRKIEFDSSAENTIKISEEFNVTGMRYCVIPTEWNEEVYCKEVYGTSDGMIYYLYYDLSTGEEIRAMVVIDEDGDKLI